MSSYRFVSYRRDDDTGDYTEDGYGTTPAELLAHIHRCLTIGESYMSGYSSYPVRVNGVTTTVSAMLAALANPANIELGVDDAHNVPAWCVRVVHEVV